MRDALGAAATIRIPRRARRQLAAIQNARSELRRVGCASPSTRAVANRAGLSVRAVEALDPAVRVTASLDEPVGDDMTPLGELIADAGDGTLRIEDRERARALWAMLGLLPRRRREVLLRRYGLGGHRAQTHEEIAAWLGVGEERSRQLERQALHWLRQLAHASRLAA